MTRGRRRKWVSWGLGLGGIVYFGRAGGGAWVLGGGREVRGFSRCSVCVYIQRISRVEENKAGAILILPSVSCIGPPVSVAGRRPAYASLRSE